MMTTILLNLPVFAFLAFFCWYDYKHMKVKNKHLLFFLPVVAAEIGINLWRSTNILSSCLEMAAGALIGGGLLLAAALFTHGGIGGGDIKLCFLLGFLTGPVGAIVMLIVGTLGATMYGFIKAKLYHNKNIRIPLVPFTAVGYLAAVGYSLL